MPEKMIVTVRGVPLEVEFEGTRAEKGHRNSFGAPEEPDYPEEVDIVEVYCEGWEILCFMDDSTISEIRRLILAQKGE